MHAALCLSERVFSVLVKKRSVINTPAGWELSPSG